MSIKLKNGMFQVKTKDGSFKPIDVMFGETKEQIEEIERKGNEILDAIPVLSDVATSGDYNDLSNKPDIDSINEKIEEIRLFKFPNATIIGEPFIDNGQVSRFSNANYLIFPFIVDVRGKNFEINFCFTTGADVTTQQNILDSAFGLALAIRNGKGLMALSSNGTNFNLGESVGTMTILPNHTYYAKLEFDGSTYTTKISQDMVTYTEDMRVVSSEGLFPTQIYIGGSPDLFGAGTAHPFRGSINLNRCTLSVAGLDVWQGMDDAGLSTRANVSLSNLDAEGEARFSTINDRLLDISEDISDVRNEVSEVSVKVDSNTDRIKALEDEPKVPEDLVAQVEENTANIRTALYVDAEGYICLREEESNG